MSTRPVGPESHLIPRPFPDGAVPAAVDGLALFGGAFWNDPCPALDALREAGPVREVDLPDGPVWLATRYADVRAGRGAVELQVVTDVVAQPARGGELHRGGPVGVDHGRELDRLGGV